MRSSNPTASNPTAELGIPVPPFNTANSAKHSFISRKGFSAAEYLRENCPFPSNATVKDFARWYCKSRRGRLDKRLNDISVRNTMKKFFSGFEKVTRTKIPDGLRIDVYVVSLGWKSRNILASVNTTAPVHPRDAGLAGLYNIRAPDEVRTDTCRKSNEK
jgi:hypothetical protein